MAVEVHVRSHARHRLVEPDVPRRPEEAGVAEGEDAAVGGGEPVAVAVAGGRDGGGDDLSFGGSSSFPLASWSSRDVEVGEHSGSDLSRTEKVRNSQQDVENKVDGRA